MQTVINLILTPEEAYYSDKFLSIASAKLKIKPTDISFYRILNKSVDARQKHILINMNLMIATADDDQQTKAEAFHPVNVRNSREVVIIGAGPAGLFAALHLIENGLKPVIFERGKDVHERKKDIALLNRNLSINPDSNYCFGEGGAGTFSDGKLYTRSVKRGNVSHFLELLHQFGATEEILYEAHPHIGSDKLPAVIENIRNSITEAGGEIYFDNRLDDIIPGSDSIQQLIIQKVRIINPGAVILATGHSSRNIYEIFSNREFAIENKGFAMGVRVEHPKELINNIQYHSDPQSRFLPSASYTLTAQANGRGVYSFCMCPGGFIVPSSTSEKEIVLNGMSASARNSDFSNSGIVVEIRQEDIPKEFLKDPLPGLAYQQYLEKLAYKNSDQSFSAPAQRLNDFIKKVNSTNLPATSYFPGLVNSGLHTWLPEQINNRLRSGFQQFDQKMKGFITNEAIIAGVESRTSSPVRIPRLADTYQHIHMKNLFPCGEGAGYSGGIVSSALDGIKTAQMVIQFLFNK